jgi:hypothetical protein
MDSGRFQSDNFVIYSMPRCLLPFLHSVFGLLKTATTINALLHVQNLPRRQ